MHPLHNTSAKTHSVLYHHEAQLRKQLISHITYHLSFTFPTPHANAYSGQATLSFTLADHPLPTFIEFAGSTITQLLIDSVPQTSQHIQDIWLNNRILLPPHFPGNHQVQISFQNHFSKTGFGLFCYREHGQTYIYSLFASNYAHTMFPCFD